MSLNPGQQQMMAIRLRMLEENLAEIERLIDHDEDGILYRRSRPRLSEARRARILDLLAELRLAIGSSVETYDLRREDQDSARRIRGLLSLAWEGVLELASSRLAGYGPIGPEVSRALDRDVDRLATLVLILEATFHEE